jgi:hypothetical protein
MNVALIILIIVILVIVLYLVYYVSASSQVLLDLNKTNAPITTDDILKPTSTSFTYSMWVYVNNWTTGSSKVICNAYVANDAGRRFKLYLDNNKPILNVDILTTDTGASPIKTVQITNNFPIQRWVYIAVSVEGPIVDCYLDGKLVKSQQLTYLPKMDGSYTINYGVFDAYLTKFLRIATSTDPQTVWNNYLAGNGFSSNSGPAYGFSFVLTKDQAPVAQYKYQ